MTKSREKSRPGRKAGSAALLGMAASFGIGTFADNFYKQAAVLLAASMGKHEVQSVATVLFSLPFICCSAWAGWLADRLPKRDVMLGSKVAELAALIIGAFALVGVNWFGILTVIFIVGLQATMFSPSLNGAIPELFNANFVPRVNGWIKLSSTSAVLMGMAFAGILMDVRPVAWLPDFGLANDGPGYGRLAAGAGVVVVSFIGFWPTLFIPRRPAARKGARQKFPWLGPVDSWRYFLECRRDKELYLVLLAEAMFYGVAVLASLSIVNLAKGLGYSDTMTSLLSASLMIGIAVGAVIAGRKGTDSWRRLLTPSGTAMSFCLLLTAVAALLPGKGSGWFVNPQLAWLFIVLPVTGVCGGIYLIPLTSFIQLRPAAKDKGKVLGVSNFLTFAAMGVFGVAFALIGLLPPAGTFIVYGVCSLLFIHLVARRKMRKFDDTTAGNVPPGFIAVLLRLLLRLRYKVTEKGLESIRDGKSMLILPNHPALIDPIIMYSRMGGLHPRILADAGQMKGVARSAVARVMNMIIMPDITRDGAGAEEAVLEAINRVTTALKAGHNVLLYPAGRIYRSGREVLGGNSGVAGILRHAPETRVILARTTGLWGSSFGYAPGRPPDFVRELLKGALRLLANGVFFMPKRRVTVEFVEPQDFPRHADKREMNRYMEDFYNKAERPARHFPYYFWQGRRSTPMPEPARPHGHDASSVSPRVRAEVARIILDAAGLPPDTPVNDADLLMADLGVDSLALMDVVAGIETRFGRSVTNLTALVTAGDCFLAAEGRLPGEGGQLPVVPAKDMRAWQSLDHGATADRRLALSPGLSNIAQGFLDLARKAPKRPLLADGSGVRTRADILTGALALAPVIRNLPGERVGIMLPAVPAATVVWLGCQLAGKTPVMLNWTVGERNMRHCLGLAGISHCLTASGLLNRLKHQGSDLEELPVTWVRLEETAKDLGLAAKAGAWLKSRLHCLGLVRVRADTCPDIAAILFTSGSEAAPKGVPLSHKNILCNARDVAEVLTVLGRDKVLGMLPPFHSFGFLVNVALPLCAGLPAALHPNPTESARLVDLTRQFSLTLLGATPAFLEGMLKAAESGNGLPSLRLAFVGAEACPERVFRDFARICPGASLCEAYGITECAPGIAVDRPGDLKPGSIGFALPSVTVAVRREDGGRAGPDEQGMLLVRGDNVFSGYLGDAPSPFVQFEGETWYATGDLATMSDRGRITFKGRLKRFVKIGGEMISLPQMEEVLLEGLEKERGAGQRELPDDGKPYLAVEARETPGGVEILLFTSLDLTAPEANSRLKAAGLSALYAVRRVVRLEAIPLLGTGKTDYRALKRLVE